MDIKTFHIPIDPQKEVYQQSLEMANAEISQLIEKDGWQFARDILYDDISSIYWGRRAFLSIWLIKP